MCIRVRVRVRQCAHLQVVRVDVGLVFVRGLVPPVAVFDHGVQQLLEHLVGLLVPRHAAHRHDEGVACFRNNVIITCVQ